MIPMVWVLLTVVFLMMRVAPGDPISATLGGKLSPEELAGRQAALGFDRPLLVQYLDYLWDAVRCSSARRSPTVRRSGRSSSRTAARR